MMQSSSRWSSALQGPRATRWRRWARFTIVSCVCMGSVSRRTCASDSAPALHLQHNVLRQAAAAAFAAVSLSLVLHTPLPSPARQELEVCLSVATSPWCSCVLERRLHTVSLLTGRLLRAPVGDPIPPAVPIRVPPAPLAAPRCMPCRLPGPPRLAALGKHVVCGGGGGVCDGARRRRGRRRGARKGRRGMGPLGGSLQPRRPGPLYGGCGPGRAPSLGQWVRPGRGSESRADSESVFSSPQAIPRVCRGA